MNAQRELSTDPNHGLKWNGNMWVTKADSTLPTAKKCPWDVTESYCGKTYAQNDDRINARKLKTVRKLETVGKMQRQTLTVNINGIETVYTLGKKNEYYLNGQTLTKTLEVLAQSKGNKVSIR